MLTQHLIIAIKGLVVLAAFAEGPAAVAQVVPNGNLTPQQQQALYLRALRMRGQGQIRTGYPQDIPLGVPGGFSPAVDPAPEQSDAAQKNSTQKRIEARKAREEQKRKAREEAQAKKAKADKKPAKPEAKKKVPPKQKTGQADDDKPAK